MWQRLKKLFKRGAVSTPPPALANDDGVHAQNASDRQYEVVTDTPWGVPVLDVQPLTQHFVSTSRIREHAKNSTSYRGDEGPEFAQQSVDSPRVTPMSLRFPVDRALFNGAINKPVVMEEKWALYLEEDELLFVRSWTRTLVVRASVEFVGDEAIIRSAKGVFTTEDEDPDYTRALLEYLVRDYGLGEVLPMPIPFPYAGAHEKAALFAFSVVGRTARFVAHQPATLGAPARQLRTVNALHLAVAQKDFAAVDAAIAARIPLSVLATDGLTVLHWAVGFGTDVIAGLLDRGAHVDARSGQGATPLMQAVQADEDDAVVLLLERGADPRAVDHRGFSALHRAAEMGQEDAARRLLEGGADPMCRAGEHTPLSLARAGERTTLVAMLEAATREADGHE